MTASNAIPSCRVEVLNGQARLIDPWKVQITDATRGVRRLTTRAIIVATGARPHLPPLAGLDLVEPLTPDDLWTRLRDHDRAPRRLAVLGGGPIGCELAQAFARLGSQATQIEMASRLMMREDPDAAALVAEALQADGVTVLTDHRALAFGMGADGHKWIQIAHQGHDRRLGFDQIIIAVGRSARLDGPGLQDLGIACDRTIQTNDFLQTHFPNILTAGDVAGPFQLTHAASHQTWFASVNTLFGPFRRIRADYRVIHWATITAPQVARVGLSETGARDQGIAVEVARLDLADLDRAVANGAAHGFVKVLTAWGRDRILGVTIAGDHAGDLIAEFVLAMKHGLCDRPAGDRGTGLGVVNGGGSSDRRQPHHGLAVRCGGAHPRPDRPGRVSGHRTGFRLLCAGAFGLCAAQSGDEFVGTGSSFLAFGAIAAKRGDQMTRHRFKCIRYLGGLTERFETIAVFLVICAVPTAFPALALIFAAACGVTTLLRWHQGWNDLAMMIAAQASRESTDRPGYGC